MKKVSTNPSTSPHTQNFLKPTESLKNRQLQTKPRQPNPPKPSFKPSPTQSGQENTNPNPYNQTQSKPFPPLGPLPQTDYPLANEKFKCRFCGKPTLSMCGFCSGAYYCTPEHYNMDWEGHRAFCRSISQLKKAEGYAHQLHGAFDVSRLQNLDVDPADGWDVESKNIQEMIGGRNGDSEGQEEAFLENRQRLRGEVVLLFGESNYTFAMSKTKELLAVSKHLFSLHQRKYFYSYIIDNLLLTKLFVKQYKMQYAMELLMQSWKTLQMFMNDKNYKIRVIDLPVSEMAELALLERKLTEATNSKPGSEATKVLRQNFEIQTNLLMLKELKRRTSLLSTIACLFYNIGDFKHAESAYILYTKLVEINYGSDSLETSNCYFLVGVFYMENKYYKRSMACLLRAKEMRVQKLGGGHLSVSDCFFNIGLIY
jgi:hypothetical protein